MKRSSEVQADAQELSEDELEVLTGIADQAVLSFVWMVDMIRLVG